MALNPIINEYVILEIQKYLYDMKYQKDIAYKGEQLNIFLKGVTCALYNYRLTFGLINDKEYRVDVIGYIDPYNFCSRRKHLYSIFDNRVEEK